MAATRAHVLIATDKVLKAFFDAKAIANLTVVRGKEAYNKTLPLLICGAADAVRKRHKNWEVTGQLTIRSDIVNADGEVNDTAKLESDTLELAVLDALEDLIPVDDRPQPLGNAITAAGVAAEAINSNEYMMTGFMIRRAATGFDEDDVWVFHVDFGATVIA